MTVKEVASYLNMPIPTVYYHIQRGNIPTIKIGCRWRIPHNLLIKSDYLKVAISNPQPVKTQDERNLLIESLVQQLINVLSQKA